MVPVEEDFEKPANEWTSKTERQCKLKAMEGWLTDWLFKRTTVFGRGLIFQPVLTSLPSTETYYNTDIITGRKARQEEMDRKEGSIVKLLRFKGRRWARFIRRMSTRGRVYSTSGCYWILYSKSIGGWGKPLHSFCEQKAEVKSHYLRTMKLPSQSVNKVIRHVSLGWNVSREYQVLFYV